MDFKRYIEIKDEIKDAFTRNDAVVALESSVICQGMPYPENYQTAIKEEETILKYNVHPATIAVIKGIIKVGLNHEEIKFLSTNKCHKIGKKDIPYALSKGLSGGLTVSGVLAVMEKVGIKVLATGGIGGVHRNFASALDISQDLDVMAETSAVVVAAGAKAILDIPKTLEYMETKGILILGYKTSTFPLFYTANSEYPLEWRVECAKDVSRIVKIKEELAIKGSVFVANPIPKEYEIESSLLNDAIAKALQDADSFNIKGKALTPYLLREVMLKTNKNSLKANIGLILNNCAVAAQIARELQ